ncbi:MAG: hypothetical protein JXB17_05915 [Bacteroidales bacterium]|nr:hypothetical protein [Bacteroidales bacterium]
MEKRFNKIYIGLIPGLLLPVISIFGLYKFKFFFLSISEFYEQAKQMDILFKIISLGVVPNLLLFFLFIWKNYLYSARGVLMATFIYAFIVFAFKLIA